MQEGDAQIGGALDVEVALNISSAVASVAPVSTFNTADAVIAEVATVPMDTPIPLSVATHDVSLSLSNVGQDLLTGCASTGTIAAASANVGVLGIPTFKAAMEVNCEKDAESDVAEDDNDDEVSELQEIE